MMNTESFYRKENINIYVIEKGSKLYRGDKSYIDPEDKMNRDYLFFTPTMIEAKQYGIVSEFETFKQLRVVALDDITESFYNNAPEEIQKYLVSNYGYNSDNKLRNTNESGDFSVSQYICEQGYDGYATNTMNTDAQGKFHQEIVICQPSMSVKFLNKVIDEKHNAEVISKEKEEATKPQRKKRPNNQRDVNDEVRPIAGLLFDDIATPTKEDNEDSKELDSVFTIPKFSLNNAFDSPPSSPRGGKRKSKMRKGQKKSKKQTRRKKH